MRYCMANQTLEVMKRETCLRGQLIERYAAITRKRMGEFVVIYKIERELTVKLFERRYYVSP